MEDVDDLVVWLRAQLDEDERVARSASDASADWQFDDTAHEGPKVIIDANLAEGTWCRDVEPAVWICDDELDGCPDLARGWAAEGIHIALHDPARVLREVEAKRAVLAMLPDDPNEDHVKYGNEYSCGDSCPRGIVEYTLRLVALPYADRPGYQESWRP